MEIKEARQELKKMLVVYRAFQHVDEILEAADGSIEAAKEAAKKIESLKKEIDSLSAQKNEFILAISQAKLDAENTLKKADATAESIVNNAKAVADSMMAAAHEEKASAADVVLKEKQKLAKLQEETAVASDEHAKIKAALEQSRANLKGLLG